MCFLFLFDIDQLKKILSAGRSVARAVTGTLQNPGARSSSKANIKPNSQGFDHTVRSPGGTIGAAAVIRSQATRVMRSDPYAHRLPPMRTSA